MIPSISDTNGGTIRANGGEDITIKVAAGSEIGGLNLAIDFTGNNKFFGWYLGSQCQILQVPSLILK